MKAIAVTTALFASMLAQGVIIQNEALRIEFADARDGFSCAKIVNRLAGDVEFVNFSKGVAGFWRLTYRGEN